jgi:hypothetical protein
LLAFDAARIARCVHRVITGNGQKGSLEAAAICTGKGLACPYLLQQRHLIVATKRRSECV